MKHVFCLLLLLVSLSLSAQKKLLIVTSSKQHEVEINDIKKITFDDLANEDLYLAFDILNNKSRFFDVHNIDSLNMTHDTITINFSDQSFEVLKTDSVTTLFFSEQDYPVNIKNLEQAKPFTCYPNPFKEKFRIKYNSQQKGSIEINLYNLSGKLIYQTKKSVTQGQNTIEIKVPEISANNALLPLEVKANGNIYTHLLMQLK